MFSTEEKTHTDFISQNWEFISHSCDTQLELESQYCETETRNCVKILSFFPPQKWISSYNLTIPNKKKSN